VRYFVEIGDETLELNLERIDDGSFRVRTTDGQELAVTSLLQRPGMHALSVAGRTVEVQLSEQQVKLGGERFAVRAQSERERVASHPAVGTLRAAKEIVAPMPGRIVRVLCAPGALVRQGEALVVIEAMKMQNELCAKSDETVRAVRVSSGDTVDRGALLVEFE
jgi:biotin carboxyl carrier protein